MIIESIEALAEKQKTSIPADKLGLTIKNAIYKLRYKRLADQSDEETRAECIKSLQKLFGEIRSEMGLSELHLTVNEWKDHLKKVKTNRLMEQTTLFALLIYEAGLCYL